MSVLAVIVNYRTPTMTMDAVEALFASLENQDDLRAVVVDNDSQNGSLEQMRSHIKASTHADRVDVVASDHNGGLGYGLNIAIRQALDSPAVPEYFFLINSDAFPDPGAVDHLVEFMDEHSDAGIVGGHIHDGQTYPSAFRFPTLASELEGSLRLGFVSSLLRRWIVSIRLPQEAQPVDWVSGSCMMCRSTMFQDIGMFDEQFFLFFEETDLCKRARDAGWLTYCEPASKIRHIGGVSTGETAASRVPDCWFASRQRYFRKHHGTLYLWAANVIWVTGYSLWRLRRWVQRKPDNDPPRMLTDFVRLNFLVECWRKKTDGEQMR